MAKKMTDIAPEMIWTSSSDKPIQLNVNAGTTYHATSVYKSQLLNIAYTWHLIHVHHRGMFNKKQILDAIFAVVDNNEFFPVAYKETAVKDTFLVRQCRVALQKLFQNSLTIPMPGGSHIVLTVILNAAENSTGQIFPTKIIEKIVDKQFKRLETTDKISQVLNLEQFRSHPEMSNIVINLANRAALELVCKVIAQNHNILNTINGLNLSRNEIQDPSPLKEFASSSIKMIDLRHNIINHSSLFQPLKSLDIDELYVMGNPCTSQLGYLDEIKILLPTLKNLDGISTHQIKQTTADTIELMFPGDVIRDARDHASFRMYKTSDMWSQVVIEHREQANKNQILKAIFEAVPYESSDFYPCYYKAARIEDVFFVRNSYEHLESLLDNGLSLRIPNCPDIPITLKMNVSNFKKGQVEPEEAILNALSERFNIMDRCLNLEHFGKSPELRNCVINLSNPRTLSTVLTLASRRFLSNLVELRLGYNKIVSVKGFRCLNNTKSVKIIDLSNNLIEELNELNIIKIPITDLNLDGNPLCQKYPSASQYVKEVKKIFPLLTKLDGSASLKQGALAAERNYLCSMDAYGFVEQFVSNYYELYDSPLRYRLSGMYHENATVSASFNYDSAKINPYIVARMNKYSFVSRNILVPSVATPKVHYGRCAIENFLKYLPPSEHDLFSFSTDTTIFQDNLVSLTITGIFKEPGNIVDCDIRFAFSRTFLFHKVATELGIFKNTCEYKIINDIFYITSPTNAQIKNSFRYSKPDRKQSVESATVEDKENFVAMFQKMTGLKTIWCSRCFTEADWDFKKAIEVFVNMMNSKKIPAAAFMPNFQLP